MRNFLMVAVAVAALASGGAAMADDFNGQPNPAYNSQTTQAGVNAYLDNKATSNEFADPTAPDSIRSHGHP